MPSLDIDILFLFVCYCYSAYYSYWLSIVERDRIKKINTATQDNIKTKKNKNKQVLQDKLYCIAIEREREREFTGIKGSHILNMDKGFNLMNIEELVQDKEAIWVAERCPPMRATCMAKPPTRCPTTCIFMCFPSNSRILFVAAKENNKVSTGNTLEVSKN